MMEDMQWFYLQSIMVHRGNNTNIPNEHLHYLLKVFSILKIRIWYDETIVNGNAPDSFGIMCINNGKTIDCLLDN